MKEACSRFAPDLKAYQDGQLGWWARQAVRRHVANCASCREEMQAMRDFSQVLQEGEGEALSPQLRARILAAVPDITPAAKAETPRARFVPRPVLAWGAVASALLLCVVLSPLFLKNDHAAMKLASTASAPSAAGSSEDFDKGSAASDSAASESGADIAANKTAGVTKTDAAKSAGMRPEPQTALPPVMTAAPASASRQAAVSAPGGSTSLPMPAATPPAARRASTGNVAQSATKTAPDTEQNAAPANSIVLMPNDSKGRAAPPALPEVAPVPPSQEAYSKINSSRLQNNKPASIPPPNAAGKSVAIGNVAPSKAESVAASRPVSKPLSVPASPNSVRSQARKTTHSKTAASDILLLVANVEQSRAAINQAVESNGGAITEAKDITYQDNTQAAMLTLNIPQDRLPALLSGLDALGEREPFTLALHYRREQSANANNAADKPAANAADGNSNSKLNAPPQQNAHSHQTHAIKRSRMAPPATPAEPKQPQALNPPQARLTIHLQEKPRR